MFKKSKLLSVLVLFATSLGIMLSFPAVAEEPSSQTEGDSNAIRKSVDELLEKLGSGSFAERKEAAKKIRSLKGTDLLHALNWMQEAVKSDDPEIRFQARDLLPVLQGKAGSVLGQARQQALAKKLKIPVTKEISLGGDVKLKVSLVPDGEFNMGSKDGGRRTTPIRRIKISEPFYMGIFEVTQEQYQQVMGTNPSEEKGKEMPVAQVSWKEASEFCDKVSKLSKVKVRLPTEAEWEYACRAGTQTRYYSGDDEADLEKIAWYRKNSDGKIHAVGQKAPNGFGLYDMLGNVWESCEDDWHYSYNSAPKDGQRWLGNPRDDKRVIRGGNFRLGAIICSSTHRSGISFKPPLDSPVGFRVVVSLKAPADQADKAE